MTAKGVNAKVTYVTGPMGSGKTTYVQQYKGETDLVWDQDYIAQALTGRAVHESKADIVRVLGAMRSAFIQAVLEDATHRASWIISARFDPNEIHWMQSKGVNVVTLAVPREECIQRMLADPTRTPDLPTWGEQVNRWWEAYEQRIPTDGKSAQQSAARGFRIR